MASQYTERLIQQTLVQHAALVSVALAHDTYKRMWHELIMLFELLLLQLVYRTTECCCT
jgi:hypothetical protein